jgi:GNAT superfamily N-acetyltransferase
MLSVIQRIQLSRGATGESVSAILVRLNSKHVEDVEQFWQGLLLKSDEPDAGLSWRFKWGLATRLGNNYEGYALECEGLTQGLLLLETQTRWSFFDRGQRLVFVDVVMTAPWNRLPIQRPPEWIGVGTALMTFAQTRSLELGYGGRVGLQSLPEAVRFYSRLGMTRLELEPADIVDASEKLPYFEYRALNQDREDPEDVYEF